MNDNTSEEQYNIRNKIKNLVLQVFSKRNIVRGLEDDEILFENYSLGVKILQNEFLPFLQINFNENFDDPQVLSEEESKNIAAYFSFGYVCGKYMNKLFHIQENTEFISTGAAYLNASGALFDDVCDIMDEEQENIQNVVTRDTIKLILTKNLSFNSIQIKKIKNRNLLLSFIMFIKFSNTIYNSQGYILQNKIFQELTNNLLQSYESEIFSMNGAKFNSGKTLTEIEKNLQLASSNLIWCIALSTYLNNSKQNWDFLQDYESHVKNLGKIIWMLDDIVDTLEDLNQGRWSYVTLFARKNNFDVSKKTNSPLDLSEELIDNGIIQKCSYELADAIHTFEKEMFEYIQDNEYSKKILISFRVYIFSWLG